MSAPSESGGAALLDLATVALETFVPLLDTAFTHATQPAWVLTLVKAEAVGRAPEDAPRAPFALVFDGPPGGPQGTWPLTHPTLGAMHVFLVPVNHGRYEAVFS